MDFTRQSRDLYKHVVCRASALDLLRGLTTCLFVCVCVFFFLQGNHVQLAEEGVIPALIDLAKTECPMVRRNCASAMRSMTCKAEIRQLLIASGAIKVILDDATNQVILILRRRPPYSPRRSRAYLSFRAYRRAGGVLS